MLNCVKIGDRNVITRERDGGVRPFHQMREMSGLDAEFVRTINTRPWEHRDDEHEHYQELCERFGYAYGYFHASIGQNRKVQYVHMLGNFHPYVDYILDKRIPVILREKWPLSQTLQSFVPQTTLCCGFIPEFHWSFRKYDIFILDAPLQRMYTQINTPSPSLTMKLFWQFFLDPTFDAIQIEVK